METKMRLKKLFLLISSLAAVFFLTSCGEATEIGNPNIPTEGEEPAEEYGYQTYSSETHHITCYYPQEWTYTEDADANSVLFSAGSRDDRTNVIVYMDILSAEPSSLANLLSERFPMWTFSTYDTSYLSGYRYENPEAGVNGGDRNDFFFLSGNILLHIVTESFSQTLDGSEVLTIIDTLRFL